jgi:hypothetical protein
VPAGEAGVGSGAGELVDGDPLPARRAEGRAWPVRDAEARASCAARGARARPRCSAEVLPRSLGRPEGRRHRSRLKPRKASVSALAGRGRVGGRRLDRAAVLARLVWFPPAATSNRACGSPAHGSPTSFTGWHTQALVSPFRWPSRARRCGRPCNRGCRGGDPDLLSAAVEHALESTNSVHALGAADGSSRYGTHQGPSRPPHASMKHGPFPMWPAFPTSEYYDPLRLPLGRPPHFPGSPVIGGASLPAPRRRRGRDGSPGFPGRPSARSTPNTPEGSSAPAPGPRALSMAFAVHEPARLPLFPASRRIA